MDSQLPSGEPEQPWITTYPVLLDLCHLGVAPDSAVMLAEAIGHVRAKRQPDGRWLLENTHPGAVHVRFEGPDGTPNRWNTLRALRVLRWYNAAGSGFPPA